MKLVAQPNNDGLLIKNATQKGYEIANVGDGVDISSRMESHRGTVQKGMTQTIKTQCENGVCVEDGDGIGLFYSNEFGGTNFTKK